MIKNSGVYIIRNTTNGKFYIGSSKNLAGRWKEHKFYLGKSKHPNKHLQSAWKKYGSAAFEFDILIYTDAQYLLKLEQLYLNKFVNTEWCYNIALSSTAPGLGRIPSTFTRERMSKSMSGRIRSKEHCKNLSIALKGNVISDETRKKISKTLLGKVESDETRLKKSLAWQGKTNNPDAKLTENDVKNILIEYNENKSNRLYKTTLAKKYNVSWNTIHRIVTKKIWKHIEV